MFLWLRGKVSFAASVFHINRFKNANMSELSVNLDATKPCSATTAPADSIADSLMKKIADGDQSAFQELLEKYGDSVGLLVGRLTGWHADSDDILQDVFLVAWQRANSFAGSGSVEGWLKRIAINRCKNHFRKLNNITRKLQRFVGLGLAEPRQCYEQGFESSEVNEDLRLAMQQLSQHDRSVLVLYYLEEMPGEEVSKVMNVKPETLHVQLHRARKKLKTILNEKNNAR